MRSRFWVPKGRSLTRQVVHKRVICRRHEGRPFPNPPPPPLPSFRVKMAPPFSFVGVDFAGPLFTKSEHSNQKTWICLFTCCYALVGGAPEAYGSRRVFVSE